MFENLFFGVDPAIQLAVEVFGNMSLGPLSKYYEGYREEGDALELVFRDGYILRIEPEKVNALVQEQREYVWELLHEEEGTMMQIDEGNMKGDSIMSRIAKVKMILKTSIIKVSVIGEEVKADSDWTVSAEEIDTLYRTYGPFMIISRQLSDVTWERKGNAFALVEES